MQIGGAPTILSTEMMIEIAPRWDKLLRTIHADADASEAFGWPQDMFAFALVVAQLAPPNATNVKLDSCLMIQPPFDTEIKLDADSEKVRVSPSSLARSSRFLHAERRNEERRRRA